MNNILPIELDYKNLVVKIKDKQGNVLNEYPAIGKMNKSVYSNRDVFQMATKIPFSSKTKEYSKAYTEQYGYTPSTAIKIIDKLRWKVLLGEDQWMTRDQLWRWCRGSGKGGKLIIDKIRWCHDNKELILQLLSDNQENLIPLFYRSSFSSVKELKEFLGKSIWKKIINNSFTRNSLIVATSLSWVNYKYTLDASNIAKRLDLPSGYLKVFNPNTFIHDDIYNLSGKLIKKERYVGNIEKSLEIVNTIRDFIAMAPQVGKGFNPNWSWKRWKEEHDKASKEILAAKFSPEPFFKGIYSDSRLVREFEDDGCKAVLLDSPLLVATEGKEMHHCVGGYVNRCKSGDYLVYSITDKEGKRSTIGLNVDMYPDIHRLHRFKPVVLQQHYGECNSKVSEEVGLFGIHLCWKINSKLGE